jgi:RNA polymerase sigma-70 factor (ECF subfamily)
MPPSGRPDSEIVAASLAEPALFAALYDRHAAPVRSYLARRVGADLAEDLIAQTFLVAFDRRARYDLARPDARPWLYGIATALVRRHRRDEVRGYRAMARAAGERDAGTSLDHAEAVIAGTDADATVRRIAAALAALPRGERDVLMLAAEGGLDHAGIAEALSVAVGTVKSRPHRARARLQPLLVASAPTTLHRRTT